MWIPDTIVMKKIVLEELTNAGVEACLSIYYSDQYDITAVSNNNCIIKLKVRMENLSSEKSNNSIYLCSDDYDFLVIVVIDNGRNRFFIISKDDAKKEKKRMEM
jgi:hypothetical protein